jgi:proteic killer suppression protein
VQGTDAFSSLILGVLRVVWRVHPDKFNGVRSKRFEAVAKVAYRKLAILHSAATLHDLKSPGLQLEALGEDRSGQHSIRINDRYRICFVRQDGKALEVEIVDYH